MTVRPSPPFRDFEVSAILREVAEPGFGKSQFRRPLKPQPREVFNRPFTAGEWAAPGVYVIVGSKVPHGGAALYTRNDDGTMGMSPLRYSGGDFLWCRETFAIVPASAYRCSDGVQQIVNPHDPDEAAIYRENFDRSGRPGWRSSTQMPRWASRLTLEVTDVRIERLNSISEDDARAEGVCETEFYDRAEANVSAGAPWSPERLAFANMWNHLGRGPEWEMNPWCCAVTFRPHLANVDDLLRQREGGR